MLPSVAPVVGEVSLVRRPLRDGRALVGEAVHRVLTGSVMISAVIEHT